MSEGGLHPYSTPLYAKVLARLGAPLPVPEWSGFVVARPLPGGTQGRDGLGAYPLTPLPARADLGAGLQRLADQGLISLVLTPDPLVSPALPTLQAAFDLCRPFKTHFLVDFARGYEPSKHHRERIRRGSRRCRIEQVRLADHLADWQALYAGLVEKRAVTGAAAFSAADLAHLAQEPRLVTLAALVDDTPAAMTIWFEHDGVVYNHLTASNEVGYANSAAFALYDAALSHFSGRVANLGGAAGLTDDPADGLAAFKRGFANASVQAMLCGAVLHHPRYAELSVGAPPSAYFPSYRAPPSAAAATASATLANSSGP